MKYLAFTLAFGGLCFGQSDAKSKKIIDDAIAALGGQKFLTMEDRIESGRAYSFYRDQLSGLSIAKIYTRYITPGNTAEDLGLRERQAFGKDGDFGVLFREDGAWEFSYRGFKVLDTDRATRFHDTTLRDIFYILRQRMNEPGLLIESRGADVIQNLPVDIVDITDNQNRTTTVYFHQSTKVPVRQTWVWRDPKTHERNEEVTTYNRYREENGINWPHQIQRERNGEKIYEMFAESVTINQNLTDSLFATPNEVLPENKSYVPPPKETSSKNAKKKK
jgi:hypothetical protein